MSEHTKGRIAEWEIALAKCARRREQALSELTAARALLRECIEWVQSEHGGGEFASQIQNYLDACDTLEGNPDAS